LWKEEPDEDDESYEALKYHIHYFGVKIPRKEISYRHQKIYELENYAEKMIDEKVSHEEVLPESKKPEK
jgi:hypothetical protein